MSGMLSRPDDPWMTYVLMLSTLGGNLRLPPSVAYCSVASLQKHITPAPPTLFGLPRMFKNRERAPVGVHPVGALGDGEGLRSVLCDQLAQPGGDLVERLVPGETAPLPLAALADALERIAQLTRVVQEAIQVVAVHA